MEINVNDISQIKEISYKEFNVNAVNNTEEEYPGFRQKSKAPT